MFHGVGGGNIGDGIKPSSEQTCDYMLIQCVHRNDVMIKWTETKNENRYDKSFGLHP